ncbi:MAG: DUF1634 domain-containing protein [Gemmatimonadaceae bacterium]
MTRRRTSAGWTDEQFDAVLARVLRGGVLLSATVVACGGVTFLARHGLQRPEYHVFRGEPGTLRAIRGIMEDALRLNGRGLIQLGLLLLISTPIARVVFSVVGFARQRDWLYVLITLAVLILLTYSLTNG